MKPPLIALTAPELGGGIGRNIINLANEFNSMGYKVDVLLDTDKGQLINLLNDKIGIKILPTSHPVGGLISLVPYLVNFRPEAILTPVVRHTALALNAKIVTRSSTRLYAEVHNTYSKTFQFLKPFKRKTRIKRIQRYYPKCNGIITVSNGVADDFSSLTGIPRTSLTTVYNPIVTRELQDMAEEPVEHPWLQAGQPPVILGVGRLVSAKNFPLLIEAFELQRKKMECRCLIIGDGPQRSDVETKAAKSQFADDIDILGHRENPFAYMKKAAIFVLSSSWEGFGNVLVEAMSTGTPVISTDCPSGPREILEDGIHGILVPVGDPSAMAEAIHQTLLQPPSRENTKRAAERFSVRTISEHYLQVFGL